MRDVTWQVHLGDVRDVLAKLPAQSVQTCVTSPPYWGLRDYGAAGQLGLEPTPDAYVAAMVEVFRGVRRVLRDDGTCWINLGDSYAAGGHNSGSRPEDLTEKQRSNAGCRYERRTAPAGLKPKDLVGIPWRVAFALQADGWYLRSDIIWHKPNPMPESVTDRPTKGHEYIFLLTKQERYYYDAAAIAEPASCDEQEFRTKARTRHEMRGKGDQEGIYHARGEAKPFSNYTGTRNKRTVWTVNEEEVEWTNTIGSCLRCGGLRVAGNGSAPTMPLVMEDSRPSIDPFQGSCAPTESPINSLWGQSQTDSPSTISAETRAASTRHTSSLSPREQTCSGVIPSRQETQQRPVAHKATPTTREILIGALTANGSVVCVCETGRGAIGHRPDVWSVATQPFSGAHFATFPEALIEPCILAGSRVGDTVLDPFTGSGTTGAVAVRHQRSFVGCELNPEYLELARRRIGAVAPLLAREVA